MLKKWALVFLVAFLMTSLSCTSGEVKPPRLDLSTGWKFMPQDNLDFARPDFDDSAWKTIEVDRTWNQQGYPKYEGFAWYRIRIVIPSSLIKNAVLKDSLIFHLGKIDDFDQVFLNGELIGENLKNVPPGTKATDDFKNLDHSFWNVPRRYSLAVDDPRIKWDRENVIAIRVYDWGVAGGIYSGDLYLAPADLSEYVKFIYVPNLFTFHQKEIEKTLALRNVSSRYRIKGKFYLRMVDNLTGETVLKRKFPVILQPNARAEYSFKVPKLNRSATLYYRVKLQKSLEERVEKEGLPYILTPPVKSEPRINGARVYGQRPGKPFLFRIAASGKRPLHFSARNLPEGLSLDTTRGIIRGVVKKAGTYPVLITVKNSLGADTKTLRIVIGDRIALTPPMGWNSWNVWGLSVTQERVYAAARAFVEKGLADHGWTYINIDDGWEIYGQAREPKRKPNGEIRTNNKFPDMKKLGDDIHALGLKFGIYSSPGPLTCGGYTGSYGHEEQDARTFASWGVDYLKYDLCSYRKMMTDQNDPRQLMPPYEKMYRALRKQNRDIVYSLCEYGNGRVWEWGARVGGNLWRTTGDIWDEWDRMFSIGFNQEMAAPYAGPGHWNDPDMLVVGWVGWSEQLHPTRLTPDEQYTHVSLWALLSAPLLLGCDLERLDDFTLNLLTNDEVIAIDQDPLGKQALPVIKEKNIQVYKKDLADGNWAVGIFNIGESTQTYTLNFQDLGLSGKLQVRDVWCQKNLGEFTNTFRTVIPAHGVRLLKIFRPGTN